MKTRVCLHIADSIMSSSHGNQWTHKHSISWSPRHSNMTYHHSLDTKTRHIIISLTYRHCLSPYLKTHKKGMWPSLGHTNMTCHHFLDTKNTAYYLRDTQTWHVIFIIFRTHKQGISHFLNNHKSSNVTKEKMLNLSNFVFVSSKRKYVNLDFNVLLTARSVDYFDWALLKNWPGEQILCVISLRNGNDFIMEMVREKNRRQALCWSYVAKSIPILWYGSKIKMRTCSLER